MIADELKSRLRVAAAFALATACTRKAPEPVDKATDASLGSFDGAAAASPDRSGSGLPFEFGEGGAAAPDASLASGLDAGDSTGGFDLSTFGHDPCPGCGMGGRLPRFHNPPKAECILGPTDPEVVGWKPRFIACYENALVARPAAGGRMIVHLEVNEKGEVTKSEVVESEVRGVVNVCVSDGAHRIRFKPGPPRRVVVPLFFYHEHG